MTRRSFAAVMAAGLVGLGDLARDARAGATVDLIFVGRNGAPIPASSAIGAHPGDTLVMGIFMRNDEPVSLAQFGIGYDTDGDDELDILSAVVWDGIAVAGAKGADFEPLSPPSTLNATLINSINSAVPPRPALPVAPFGGAFAAAFPHGYQMGTVVWTVNAGVNTDGIDIMPGLNLQGAKGQAFIGAGGILINSLVQFNPGAVNLTPEPGTAALLGLGLVGIVALGCRRNRLEPPSAA